MALESQGNDLRRSQWGKVAFSLLAFVLLAGVGYVVITAYLR